MALRLRRGTDDERLSVVFAEGELVYTTDTKELYVGDGSTLGGLRVTGSVEDSPIALTRNLSLSTHNINGTGNISINGSVSATNFSGNFVGNGSGLTNLPVLNSFIAGGDYRINIVGDDSSVMLNTSNQTLTGNVQTSQILTSDYLVVSNPTNPTDPITVSIHARDEQATVNLKRKSNTDTSGQENGLGRITFSSDDLNGETTSSVISATTNFLFMANDATGAYATDKWFSMSNGNFGFGTFSSNEKLTVAGNAVVDGFLKVGRLTTTQRDALTASNGMLIYNTTDQRFQGYQNGGWVSL